MVWERRITRMENIGRGPFTCFYLNFMFSVYIFVYYNSDRKELYINFFRGQFLYKLLSYHKYHLGSQYQAAA